jgi:hypothetical protein
MTKEQFNLTVIMSILPSVADKLEDFPFRFKAKQLQNEVVRTIRNQDKHFMDIADKETIIQQNDIQRAFLGWLDEQFKDITDETN